MLNKFRKIFFIIKDHKKKILFLLLCFFVTSVLDIIGLSLIGPFLSVAFDKTLDFQNLIPKNLIPFDLSLVSIGTFLVILFVVKILISLKLSKMVITFAQKLQVDLRLLFLKKIQNNSFNELNKNSMSEYLNIQQSVIPIFSNFLMSLIQFLGELSIGVIIVIFLFIKDPILFSFLLFIIFITIFSYDIYARKSLLDSGEKSNFFSARMINFIKESITGYKEIKIYNKENFIKSKLQGAADRFANAQININFLNVIPRYLIELILLFSIIIISSLINLFEFQKDQNFISLFGVYAFGAVRLLPIARNFSFTLNRLNSSTHSIEVLFEHFKNDRFYEKKYKKIFHKTKFKNLDLININFKYPNRKIIFKNFNLRVNKSKKILIKGYSGKGKTTLLNILMGLLNSDSGEIKINSKKVKEKSELHRLFAYLPQETFMINDTILNNVILGDPPSSKNKTRFNKSIKEAGLKSFIDQLKDSENTLVGENGFNLSGGQKQKIAIARAIYSQREILVLDEATNALDKSSEDEIFKNLSENKKITIIVVAHKNIFSFKYDHLIKL